MKSDRTKNATRNIVYGVLLRIYQLIIPFLLRTAMVYYMGVQFLGLDSLFVSVIQVLNLAELGVESAMIYSMYRPIIEDDSVRICALMRLYKIYYRVIGTVIAIIGLLLTPLIPKLIHGSIPDGLNIYTLYLLNLFATVFSYWFFAYRNSILEAHQRKDVISKVGLITNTIQFGLQFAVLIFIKNYYVYVMVALFSQILTNVITAIASYKLYPNYKPVGRLEKTAVNEINGRIKDLFTAKLGNTLLGSADTLVISGFIGLTMLAIYQNYYYIMTAVTSFVMIMISSCSAGIGNSLASESLEKNYNDLKKLSLMVCWISGICVCCFLNLYQPFMAMWMGEENMLRYGCVILLCIYSYIYITNHVMVTYKDAAGMWHEDRFRPFCSAMFNLLLNLLLVKHIGIFAIILSTVISYVFVNMPWLVKNLFSVVFKCSPKEYVKSYIKYSMIVILAAAASFVICRFVPDRGIIAICLRLAISIIIPNIVFVVLMGRDKNFAGVLDVADRMTNNKFGFITKKLRKITE